MTTYSELLVFRDRTGEIRLVDSAPVSAVELVGDQKGLCAMLKDAVNTPVAGPVFAVIEGGKHD